MTTTNLPLHCISLTRAGKRRQDIIHNWQERYGFDIRFFDAFDRRDLPEGAVLPYDPDKSIATIGRPLTDGEIACLTSHYLLCTRLLESECEEAIIIEDDAIPNTDAFMDKETFYCRIRAALASYPNVEALMLGNPYNEPGSLRARFHRLTGGIIPVPGIYRCYSKTPAASLLKTPPWGARCTWYSRAGLKRMQQFLQQVNMPADHLFRHYFAPDRLIAQIHPPLALHEGKESYIENDRFIFKKRHFHS